MVGLFFSMIFILLLLIAGYGMISFSLVTFMYPGNTRRILRTGLSLNMCLVFILWTIRENLFSKSFFDFILFGAISGVAYCYLQSGIKWSAYGHPMKKSGQGVLSIFLWYAVIGIILATVSYFLIEWMLPF
jgi:hypothetical protein